jgi:hypothetical protein
MANHSTLRPSATSTCACPGCLARQTYWPTFTKLLTEIPSRLFLPNSMAKKIRFNSDLVNRFCTVPMQKAERLISHGIHGY